MRINVFFFAIAVLLFVTSSNSNSQTGDWSIDDHGKYESHYQKTDAGNMPDYNAFFEKGIKSVEEFIGDPYTSKIKIYVHPNRASLDKTWQTDWKMPGFKSECWMVASGVDKKMDILSPKKWTTEACEHDYSNLHKTQMLITHELFHVYHGGLNMSPDFSNTDGIDWFVEGFATYASGQAGKTRIDEVKKALLDDRIPKTLDGFWAGALRYGLSGSAVAFIDQKYGRKTLKKLLKFNKKSEILSELATTERDFLKEWKTFIEKDRGQ